MAGAHPFQAVLFDMDGTLLDTERLYGESLVEVGRRHGIEDLMPTFLKIVGLSGPNEMDVIESGLEGKVTAEALLPEWHEVIAERLTDEIPVKEGAVELLTTLRNGGVPIGLVTSTWRENALQHLELAALLGFFEHIVGGDEVQNKKPHPEPYLTAADLFGIDASRCAIFEDSDPGTLAAVRSGGTVVQVPDLKAPSAEGTALGHIIAPSLLDGARQINLI